VNDLVVTAGGITEELRAKLGLFERWIGDAEDFLDQVITLEHR
jgi:hypothetical protein